MNVLFRLSFVAERERGLITFDFVSRCVMFARVLSNFLSAQCMIHVTSFVFFFQQFFSFLDWIMVNIYTTAQFVHII